VDDDFAIPPLEDCREIWPSAFSSEGLQILSRSQARSEIQARRAEHFKQSVRESGPKIGQSFRGIWAKWFSKGQTAGNGRELVRKHWKNSARFRLISRMGSLLAEPGRSFPIAPLEDCREISGSSSGDLPLRGWTRIFKP